MPAKTNDRRWPGYEPVPGKKHSQGSCRPKSKKSLSASEKRFRSARDKQLSKWKAEHPASPKKAAQHLHKPGTKGKSK
jgi:hypothetical protein